MTLDPSITVFFFIYFGKKIKRFKHIWFFLFANVIPEGEKIKHLYLREINPGLRGTLTVTYE
jgi:hypothetical protein